jgi:hypothetical protein
MLAIASTRCLLRSLVGVLDKMIVVSRSMCCAKAREQARGNVFALVASNIRKRKRDHSHEIISPKPSVGRISLRCVRKREVGMARSRDRLLRYPRVERFGNAMRRVCVSHAV